MGHFLAALVGTCLEQALGTSVTWLKGALAVSVAILLMQFTKSLHPPAGATAFYAATAEHGQVLSFQFFVTKEGFFFSSFSWTRTCSHTCSCGNSDHESEKKQKLSQVLGPCTS